MTDLGADLVRMAVDALSHIGRELEEEIASIQIRESTRRWHRGESDSAERMTIEIGDESQWYVMRMPHAWDLCEVAKKPGGLDEHVKDYVDVRDALRALVAREVAMRLTEIL